MTRYTAQTIILTEMIDFGKVKLEMLQEYYLDTKRETMFTQNWPTLIQKKYVMIQNGYASITEKGKTYIREQNQKDWNQNGKYRPKPNFAPILKTQSTRKLEKILS